MHSVLTAVALLCALLALAGAAYFAMCIVAAHRFQRERSRLHIGETPFTPPVSILKSLKGLDPHMYSAFRSHGLLDYPEYEVLFGVSDANDPALALVEKLREEFPQAKLRVVHCPQALGPNGKVSNLAQMLPQARYEHIIINDSDILVPRNYLQRVLTPLTQPGVGMVTALYRGLAGRTLGSKLEALGLSTDFSGGVLVARVMEGGIRFALGATIATSKTVLREIGGLQPLADYLGDDYELGARTAAAGYQVRLADIVVETALPDYSFREFWAHQLRWARNVRDRRGAQYFGLIVSFGLIWAVLAVVAAPRAWWTWLALAVTAALRLTSAVVVGRGVLAVPQVLRDLWLLPLRDLVALAIWLVSYFGDEVEWRGMRFRLHHGKLERI
jgi:ceramide glucosyltransferase